MKISKVCILFLQTAVIVCMAGFILFYNLTRSRVIILHSYSSKIPEVTFFNEGFSTIANEFKNPYLVYTYMNMGLATSEEDRMRLGLKIRTFIKDFNPDIIVAVGEEAQEYAARYYSGSTTPQIVFSGIHHSSIYGYDHSPNVTGILEELPLQAIKDVLKKNYKMLLKEKKDVSLYFLGDKTFRVTMEKDHAAQQNWAPFVWKGFKQVETFDDWQKAIVQLYQNQDNGILFISGYYQLKIKKGTKEVVSPKELIQWTIDHSPYPIIGLYEHHFQDGIPVSLSSSARESGEKAALYVQALIEGKKPSSLPPLKTEEFMVGIRKIKENRFPLTLPKSFEVIAQTNKRYEDEKTKL